MTPIEKNIIVVDEYGNEYEATYPKRAKGLVKNGRARFIAENKICLACPPKNELEDNDMSEESKIKSVYNIEYILSQIEKIQEQTDYLNNALEKLSQMGDGDSGNPGAPGNIQGKAKAQAIGDIVRCRETTNQKMLSLYEKMYDDLKQIPSEREKIVAMLVGQLENSKVPDTTKDYIMETLQVALQDLSKNL